MKNPFTPSNDSHGNASQWARMTAARAWCSDRCQHKVLDPDLCESFAEVLDQSRAELTHSAPTEDAARRNASQRQHEAFVREVTGQGSVPEFRRELESVINRHSQENHSNTPDFMLASFLCRVLEAFGEAVKDRDSWYGRGPNAAAVDAVRINEPSPVADKWLSKPACIEKHQADYKQEAWRDLSFIELALWVEQLTKRAGRRTIPVARDKDLYDAGNYLAMLNAKFEATKAELTQ